MRKSERESNQCWKCEPEIEYSWDAGNDSGFDETVWNACEFSEKLVGDWVCFWFGIKFGNGFYSASEWDDGLLRRG